MIKIFACLVASISVALLAEASRERYLVFNEFRIEADARGDIGRVVVTGNRNDRGSLESLHVGFLELSVIVPESMLSRIPRYANGIRLSAETGYRELGGRTIYVVFSRAGASSPPNCDDQWIIAVSEFQGAELQDRKMCYLREAENE